MPSCCRPRPCTGETGGGGGVENFRELLRAVAISYDRGQSLTVGGTDSTNDPLAPRIVQAPPQYGVRRLRRTTSGSNLTLLYPRLTAAWRSESSRSEIRRVQPSPGQLGEETLDGIEPGCRFRRVVKGEARMAIERRPAPWGACGCRNCRGIEAFGSVQACLRVLLRVGGPAGMSTCGRMGQLGMRRCGRSPKLGGQ